MFEGYKGKVIHFIGGINEYLGELDQSSALSENWIRIYNPVLVRFVTRGVETGLMVERLGGPGEAYEKFVDLWLPDTLRYEVRVLREDGHLYATYIKQREMPRIENIVLPGTPEIQRVKPKNRQ